MRYILALLGVLFAASIALGTIESGKGANKRREPQWVAVAFGGLIAGVVISIFRVTGPIEFDLGRRVVSLPRRWPWDAARREYPLDDFGGVLLQRETRQRRARSTRSSSGGTKTYTVFTLKLAGKTGPALELREDFDYTIARRHAEVLAEFLHRPLTDRTEGQETTRQPSELDETYVNRIRRRATRLPALDGDWRGRITIAEPTAIHVRQFVLPRQTTNDLAWKIAFEVVMLALILSAFWMVGMTFFPKITVYVMAGLVVAVVAVNVAFANEQTLVTASTDELRVDRKHLLISFTERIEIDKLEEFEFHAGGLLARSDERVVRFGETLTHPERNWLHHAITYALMGEPMPDPPPIREKKRRRKMS